MQSLKHNNDDKAQVLMTAVSVQNKNETRNFASFCYSNNDEYIEDGEHKDNDYCGDDDDDDSDGGVGGGGDEN